ncbi:hypothetical protein N8697_02695 [bacterium]|nr:hypothetical protein [bacterium]
MTYKLVMAVTCFGMMAGDAIAQERGGRERGEGAQRRERGEGTQRRERPSGAAGEQRRERGEGAQRRERPDRAAGGQSRERGQGAERRQRPSGTSRERGSQSGGRGGQGGPGGFMRMFPVMSALDSDGNGEISPEEIKGAVAALKKLDKNKDGKLTEDELRPNFGGRGGASGQRPSRGGEGRGGQRPSGGGEGRGGQRPSRPSPGE